MVKEITVLRYGHRHVRDYRVTSHCCLVARAFGAKKTEVMGEKDPEIEKTVKEVNARWGKGADVEFYDSWRKRVKHYRDKGFTIVHLTMYGLPIQNVEKKIREKEKVLAVIGSQKVEREVYETADFNVSITTQPHSEIAALAVFLDRIMEGRDLEVKFPGAKIGITPSEKGKKTENLQN